MKGKINKNGNLYIQRGNFMSAQRCPYANEPCEQCGDWCPLFGEPQGAPDDLRTLRLCHTNLMFEDQLTLASAI